MTDAAAQTTQANRALVELRRRILTGEIAGDTRLFEVPLAAELHVSRTPLREAMSRLSEDGLLTRARGGFVVRRFTMADVADALELRGVLEGTAARLAAERGPPPEAMAQMRATVAALDLCFTTEGEVDLDAYAAANATFHDQLAALPGSRMIRTEIARAAQLPFASPSAFLPDGRHLDAFHRSLTLAQAQHHALVEAIAEREGARAEAIGREHARTARRNLDAVMRDGGDIRGLFPGLALVVD